MTATDKGGRRATKTVHYTVLSRGTITITGPVTAFRLSGAIWIDSGLTAACPGVGPACVGFVHSHFRDRPAVRAAAAGPRVGHADVRIAGGKSAKLVYKLGTRRSRQLEAGRTVHVWIDAELSRGTPRFAHVRRLAAVAPPR